MVRDKIKDSVELRDSPGDELHIQAPGRQDFRFLFCILHLIHGVLQCVNYKVIFTV